MLLLMIGCKSTAVQDGGPPVPSPGTLSLQVDGEYGVTLSWGPPSTSVDGFVVEGHGPGQDFAAIANGRVGPATLQLKILISPDAPELAQFEFRVRSFRGAALSPPSNVVSYQSPILAPGGTRVFRGDAGIDVWWGPGSRVADHVLIERTDDPQSTLVQRSWTVSVDGGYLFDDEVAEATLYWYRFRSVAGDRTSKAVALDAQTYLWSIVNLMAESLPGAVRLTWANRSLLADEIVVTRSSGQPVILDAGTTSWIDTDVLEDVYTYWLTPTKDSWNSVESPMACAAPSPDGGVLKLRAKLRAESATIGQGTPHQNVLLPDDTWCFFQQGTVTCQLPDAGSDTVTVFDQTLNAEPTNAALLAEGSRLHAVYTSVADSRRSGSVVREIRNDGQWNREVLADGGRTMGYVLGTSGVQHAIWYGFDLDQTWSFPPEYYGRWDQSGHTSILVPWLNSPFGPVTRLAAGPENEALVALLNDGAAGWELDLAHLLPDGGSFTEVLPAGSLTHPGPLEMVTREDTGDVWIAYQGYAPDQSIVELRVIHGHGGSWSPPTVVTTTGPAGFDERLFFLMEPEGDRQAIVSGASVFITTDGGWALAFAGAVGQPAFQQDGGFHLFIGTRTCQGRQLEWMMVSLELME